MKRSSGVYTTPSFVQVILFLLLFGFSVLACWEPAEAVRVSEEEVVGKPPAKPAPTAVVPEKPAVQKKTPPAIPKTELPVQRRAKPKPAVQKPPVAARPELPTTTKPQQVISRPKPSEEKKPVKRAVTIDFDNVDILLFVKFISEVTGKNFIIDNKVKGKVTIISPTKISVDEAYRVFESVLEVHGFTTIESGDVVKIVPSTVARGKSIETRLREEAVTPEDKVITQLIRLDYANPDELKKLFAPLISKSSVIVSYPPSGMLIVTDVESNIQRLLRIISAIDVVGIGEEISVIPLEHATASVLVKPLTTIFQTTGRTTARKGKKVSAALAPAIKIVADERTNSVILGASEHDTVRIKQLIKMLDQETPRGTGDIRVHYLQYADAEELAKVLTNLPTKKDSKGATKGKAPTISKDVQIVADKATNSLVITANKEDYLALADVIDQLDIARPMVFIEALIMEVKADKDFRIGVEWRIGSDDIGSFDGNQVGGFAGSRPGDSIIPVGPSLNQGLHLGVLGESISIGGIDFPSIAAVTRAFQSDSDIHILQTPQILTADNEEAEIQIVDNIPYLTKEATGDQEYQTYEYRDVGVKLKLTPQINRERFVRLKVFQEYSTVSEGSDADRPSTLKRTAETTVVVKDTHTLVIGGLISDQISSGTSGVPCLADIPGLGWLFKSYQRTTAKTNLFIFITPHVIETPEEAEKISGQRQIDMQKRQEGVIKMYEKPEPGAPESEAQDGNPKFRFD